MDLRLHPDGFVYLGNEEYTVAEIQAVVPGFTPPLSQSLVSAHYRPNEFFRLATKTDVQSRAIPWALGDTVLAARDLIRTTAIATRQAAQTAAREAAIAAEAARVAALPPAERAEHYVASQRARLLLSLTIDVSRSRRGLPVPPAVRAYLDTTADQAIAILSS